VKASRLLSILMLLQSRGRMTSWALAQAMEVSVRTILRDVDQLSAAGVPLWGERGRHGGFQLRPGWSTQLTGMTQPEAAALLLAGLPGPATELGLGTAAASARLKLVASLPAEWRDQAEQVGQRLHIDPLDWHRAPDTPHGLREVADAVWNARRIQVQYESWQGTTRRELEPLGLVLKAGAWYVPARRTGQIEVRTYRLASIVSLQSTGKAFRRPRGFDLAAWWRDASARFEAGLRRVPARVWLSPRGLKRLRNARVEFTALPGDGAPAGWQHGLVALESIEQGALQLLGWGAEVQVLEPAALRDEVLRLARHVVALHAGRAADPVRKKTRQRVSR
jgi:predicted DNA-binding transcriptional regulator YafY